MNKNYLPSIAATLALLMMVLLLQLPKGSQLNPYFAAQTGTNPSSASLCNDSLDNDGDGSIDFPNDPGCQSLNDNDEVDSPLRGTELNAPNQLIMSFLKDQENDYAVRANTSAGEEFLPLVLQDIFQDNPNEALQNAETAFIHLQAQDNSGKKYSLIKEARHWDLSLVDDDTRTPEPYYTVFQSRGDRTQCLDAVKNIPSLYQYTQSPAAFQILLDLISLCQR